MHSIPYGEVLVGGGLTLAYPHSRAQAYGASFGCNYRVVVAFWGGFCYKVGVNRS